MLNGYFWSKYFRSMKLDQAIPLKEIAELINAEIIGNADLMVTGINEIHKVTPGDITFVDFEKYYKTALESAATIIIINKKVECPEGKALLYSENPFKDYNGLTQRFMPFQKNSSGNFVQGENVNIGENNIIQPNVVIGNNVTIGSNCIIHPNVVIYDHTVIGDNVIIQANTTIGGDAFYFKGEKNRDIKFEKWHSCGRVIIEDWVEVGAGCTIDKGVSGDTILGQGTKLDNHVHIAHGVVVGKNCLIAAQVGIAGKTTIEDECLIWGQAGISKDLTVGKGSEILAQSGIGKTIEGGKRWLGSPAVEAREKAEEFVWVKRIPELWKKVNDK